MKQNEKEQSTYLSEPSGLLEIPLQALESEIVVLEVRAVAPATATLLPALHRAVIGHRCHICSYVVVARNVAVLAARTVSIDGVTWIRMGVVVRVAEGVEARGERVEGRGRRHEGREG